MLGMAHTTRHDQRSNVEHAKESLYVGVSKRTRTEQNKPPPQMVDGVVVGTVVEISYSE